MINSKDLQMLIAHYRVNTPDEAIDLASKEFDNVVNKDREYPPFMYYMILSYLDGNMNYDKKFKDMSMTEKRKVFDETIESLKTQKLV
ncbi:MAG: hypothetical protein IKO36_05625 [Bacteroidaceae bacterium]|nr:hypothetical protein [Bacteroidaceae bacterium]